jgi:hypothetical protein
MMILNLPIVRALALRLVLAVAAGALTAVIAAGTDLRGYVQANYTHSVIEPGGESERDVEQIRLYLRDHLFVKNEWTLEYGFDRAGQRGGLSIERPRYATTLRGEGYQANLSFVPLRTPAAGGGTRSDEWRSSLSILGTRWPQLSLTYFRRNDRQNEDSFSESWLGSAGVQREWMSARANLQGQRQSAATRNLRTRAILAQGDLSLTPDLGSRVRTAAGYGISVGKREGTLPRTTTIDQTGSANVGVDLLEWASWDAGASGRWGEMEQPNSGSQTRELVLSSGLSLKPVSPLEISGSYFRNRFQSLGTTTLQESISGGALLRVESGEAIYATGQATRGRQLASSVGPYDFLSGILESGGRIYRMTRFRLTATGQRNNGSEGQVVPLQLSRQGQIEIEPYSNLQASATYTATYGGPVSGLLGTTVETAGGNLTTHPRGLGSWSISYTRNWTNGVGTDRYLTVYGSTRNDRGLGLSAAYTWRELPTPIGANRKLVADSLQGRAELEMRNGLTLGISREETDLGRVGGKVDWQATARWSF